MSDNGGKGKAGSSPIIRKIKKNQHKHHGGSWKIAFADFVTAMMAFFLLMWLIASLNKAQKDGIAEYFKQPMKITFFGGKNVGNQQINLKGGGPNIKDTNGQVSTTDKASTQSKQAQDIQVIQSDKEQTQKLEELKSQINLSIQQDPSLSGLKNRLLMRIVSNGLRIQLVDNKDQSMFDVGSDKLNPNMDPMFAQIAKLLSTVPNAIIIEGHTDAHPYHNPDELEYTNWELSTQRANAARRALIKAGLNPDRVKRVSGFGSTMLLNLKDPYAPENRRISIIVMKSSPNENLILKGDHIMINKSNPSNQIQSNTSNSNTINTGDTTNKSTH
ncbi:flagellar motor protein MotB [Legionella cherrii]|uniref:Chemotaxis protein MotB n=1 Tax=Legionella cherrii TaxID=28084 RepID=A0A0W0SGX5_9GAMM|nr:flagellar motor protein MotB [Legionella cherrii]KTC82707.1 flagellar motor protein MotB [Legionella cherrii]VEB35464.1 chemotaxis protein MotB [Legionella cherrii]